VQAVVVLAALSVGPSTDAHALVAKLDALLPLGIHGK
jgi:hypothetical protein